VGRPTMRMVAAMGSPPGSAPLSRWASIPLVAAAAGLLLATVAIGAIHVDDRYRVDTASGARIALARYFDEGTLYPPLYDGEHYGGTRFMPLPLIFHGLAAELTGEYLVSGKALSYLTMLGVVAMMMLLLRRYRSPWPLALALIAVVFATNTGLSGTMSLRADSLPLLLQLGALALADGRLSRGRDITSALLAAAAFMAELSAIWAPLAITLHLGIKDRSRAMRFAAVFVVAAGASFGIAAIASGGRIVANVLGLAGAGIRGPSAVLVAPYRFLTLVAEEATAAAVLLPFAFAGMVRELRDERRLSLVSWSLVISIVLVIVVLTDIGTGWNQLLDVVVLSAIAVGRLAGGLDATGRPMRHALVAASLWAAVIGGATVVVPAGLDALAAARDPELWSSEPLGDERGEVLSEDPFVPVSMSRDPVVLDPFMLPRIGAETPGAIDDLVRRIGARDFDVVVLTTALDPPDKEWWRDYHFGSEIARSIARSYSPVGRAQGYFLYEPVEGDDEGT
jgi:hypothetical protein